MQLFKLTNIYNKIEGLFGVFATNILKLGGTSILGYVVAFAAAPLLTRIYSPESFSYYQTITIVVTLTLAVATLRYEMALPVATEKESASLVSLALFLLAVMSLIVGVGYSLYERSYIGALVSIWIFVWGIYNIFRYYALRDAKTVNSVAMSQLLNGLGRVGAQILAGITFLPFIGLVAGDVFGRFLGAQRLYQSYRAAIVKVDFNTGSLLKVACKHKRFAIFLAPSAFISTLAQSLPFILISFFYDDFVAGQFALVTRLAAAIGLINTSVGQALIPEVSARCREKRSISNLLFQSAKWLIIAGILVIALTTYIGSRYGVFIFGEDWLLAGQMLSVIGWVWGVMILINTLSHLVYILNGQHYLLMYDIVKICLESLVIYLFASRGFDALTTVQAYVASSIVVYVFLGVIIFRLIKRYENSLSV